MVRYHLSQLFCKKNPAIMPDKIPPIEKRFIDLAAGYYDQSLTDDQSQELERICRQRPELRRLLEYMEDESKVRRHLDHWDLADTTGSLPAMQEKLRTLDAASRARRTRIEWAAGLAVAASLLAVVLRGVIMSPSGRHERVVLSLSDGQELSLNNAAKGQRWEKEGVMITKTDSNKIHYDVTDAAKALLSGSNDITTRVGGQYNIRLPDGTNVWLNNVSNLNFPSAFDGGKRIVHLTGEAFFDVAKDPDKPFFVSIVRDDKEELIEVLGTSFNIRAYPDEPQVMTTVVSGSVRASRGTDMALLVPGQQLTAGKDGSWQTSNTDTTNSIDWKKSIINFDNDDIWQAMQKLVRWYDIEPEIRHGVHSQKFVNRIPRTPDPEDVLKALSNNGQFFKYRFEGKKLVIN